jgi:hypothetical protein
LLFSLYFPLPHVSVVSVVKIQKASYSSEEVFKQISLISEEKEEEKDKEELEEELRKKKKRN